MILFLLGYFACGVAVAFPLFRNALATTGQIVISDIIIGFIVVLFWWLIGPMLFWEWADKTKFWDKPVIQRKKETKP